jgi:hypothetical protein
MLGDFVRPADDLLAPDDDSVSERFIRPSWMSLASCSSAMKPRRWDSRFAGVSPWMSSTRYSQPAIGSGSWELIRTSLNGLSSDS